MNGEIKPLKAALFTPKEFFLFTSPFPFQTISNFQWWPMEVSVPIPLNSTIGSIGRERTLYSQINPNAYRICYVTMRNSFFLCIGSVW
jgi:hypothetical protein